jgi:hypothetical protein
MAFVRNGWSQASGRQKGTIVVAVVLALGAVGNLGEGGTSGPSASPGPTTKGGGPGLVGRGLGSPIPTSETDAPVALVSPTIGPTAAATVAPTPVPTAPPAPTPGPTPTPTPRPTAAPSLTLAFTSLTSPAPRNSDATATVKTKPGAACKIVVMYKSGPSKAQGLGPTTADASGVASWTWRIGPSTTLGTWPVTVTCSSGGQTKSVTKGIQVV